jgi:hypothetical protein
VLAELCTPFTNTVAASNLRYSFANSLFGDLLSRCRMCYCCMCVPCRDKDGHKAVAGVKEGVAGPPYVNRLGLSPEVPEEQAKINKQQAAELKRNLAMELSSPDATGLGDIDITLE